jgi:Tfp pilus assembly protein PilV|tara:strand:- start:72 stop:473 length:402 start_codon:yes stop_codon:yes gene_type:complete
MSRQSERGVALIAAIFLVVIIGAGVVLLSTLSVRSSQQTTQNLLQLRAQLSVNAALEYGVQALVEGVACADLASPVNIASYPGFGIGLVCTSNDYNRVANKTISILSLVATAEWGSPADADYVWAESEAAIEL